VCDMKRLCCIVLVLCTVLAFALPITATDAAPFDEAVSKAMEAVGVGVGTDTAGAAVVVYKNGAVLMADGFGYADLASESLVTAKTVFEIGDISAVFVAVSALTLVERGELSLGADIAEYLPADFMAQLALNEPVTVRQLLSGRAGFGGRIFDLSFTKQSHCFETLEEALLADVPTQVTAPGTAYLYSPFGIALAAFVIENITGVPYHTYVAETVFAPLGMKDTVALVGDAAPNAYATGYTAEGNGHFTADGNGGKSYAGLYPATGALSTAADLSLFLAWLLDGADTLLSALTKAQLFTAYQSGIFTPTALGLRVAGTVYSCQTRTDCFAASLSLDTAKREAVLVLTNTGESMLHSLPGTLLPATVPPPTVPGGELLELKELRGTYAPATLEQHSFVGRYLTSSNCFSVAVNEDGTLRFGDLRLVQVARGVFADAAGDGTTPVLQFLFDPDGKAIAAVTSAGESYQKLPFYYGEVPSTLLLGLLMIFTAGFALLGVFGVFEWFAKRNGNGERLSIFRLLPDLLSALLAIFVGVQVLVAYKIGADILSSFYFAMRVLTLLAGIGATVVYVAAFVLTVLDRKLHQRIVYAAFFHLAYVLLICFFGLALI